MLFPCATARTQILVKEQVANNFSKFFRNYRFTVPFLSLNGACPFVPLMTHDKLIFTLSGPAPGHQFFKVTRPPSSYASDGGAQLVRLSSIPQSLRFHLFFHSYCSASHFCHCVDWDFAREYRFTVACFKSAISIGNYRLH